MQPVLGAGFPTSPFYARERIAVISHRLWRERFGSDPSIVGKTVALNGPLFTVVGVMPQGFQYPNNTDVWHRITWDVAQHSRGAHFMESIVRLKPGVTSDAANNELRALTKRLGLENPSTNGDYTARAVPLATEVVGVPLVKGRFFNANDNADAPGVIIVNDALVRVQWPGEDPIGQTVISPITVIGPMGRSLMKRHLFQVIGVVAV